MKALRYRLFWKGPFFSPHESVCTMKCPKTLNYILTYLTKHPERISVNRKMGWDWYLVIV